MSNFQFKGVWIPDFVMEMLMDGKLTPTDIVLLSMIFAMSKGKEGCYASREYLADKLGMSVSHVKNLIARYRKMGLIVDLGFDGRRQKICTVWDVGYSTQYGRGTVESTADLPQEAPRVERGTVESTAHQAYNNKEKKSNRFFSNQRGLSPSPNLTDLEGGDIPSPESDPDLVNLIRRKTERKNSKNFKTPRFSNSINREEGLAISLTDTLPEKGITELADKYGLTAEEVLEQKQKYIDWITEWSAHAKTWGRNMTIVVDRFCSQVASKKHKKKSSDEPDPINDDLFTYYDKKYGNK